VRDLLGYDKIVMPLSSLEAVSSYLAVETVDFVELDEEE
jgi:hypothetical protein